MTNDINFSTPFALANTTNTVGPNADRESGRMVVKELWGCEVDWLTTFLTPGLPAPDDYCEAVIGAIDQGTAWPAPIDPANFFHRKNEYAFAGDYEEPDYGFEM